jgi:plastocyanin domain-containing protein
MSAADVVVLGAGIAAIGAIYWWFFAARGPAVAATVAAGGVQELVITVAGGYEPATVTVQAGRPVRLVFDRRETNPCSEEVVLPAFGVQRFLPAHERTPVEFTPTAAGRYDFTCGMGMLHGTLIVTAR